MSEQNTRQDFIRGLHEIADYYETHPSLPLPSLRQLNVSAEASKQEAERLARLLAPCAKQHGNTVFSLIKVFSGMTLNFVFWRSAVCTRRIVGHKDVPEETRPAHREEIVEWDCDPILRDAEREPAP